MTRYFCTYFDVNYLTRGLALYRSLKEHCDQFLLFILCLDKKSYYVLSKLALPGVKLIKLDELEKGDAELLNAKKNRLLAEYYFTCTPSLLLFVLNNFKEVDLITYVDADIYFFSDPTLIYEEIAGHSIAIVGHRFAKNIQKFIVYGKYNVTWLSFKRVDNSFACLKWWRDRCNEWCYYRLENGKFADQKYLDDWPLRFNDVTVLHHKGINVAPWNLANYKITYNESRVLVDEEPLIFFHFHYLKQLTNWLYHPGLGRYRVRMNKTILNYIYMPYLNMLFTISEEIKNFYAGKNMIGSLNKKEGANLTSIFIKICLFLSIIYRMVIFNDYIVFGCRRDSVVKKISF